MAGWDIWRAPLALVPAELLRAAAIPFGACLVASAALTPVVSALARHSGLLDHALSSRKIRGKPVPRLGGIAIVVAFYGSLLALYLTTDAVSRAVDALGNEGLGLLVGGIFIAAVGLYDDVRGAGVNTKFAAQFGVAAVAYAYGIRIDAVALPCWPPLHLGGLGLPVTLLWIVAVINAWNLIDGLDGLAGGLTLIALATLSALAFGSGQLHTVMLAAALAGAVLGFLFFNFHPASVFMGDTGSMFLGFALATGSIQAQRASEERSFVVAGMALAIPLFDTALAVVRRALRGAPLFAADRGHIHHALLRLGCSQRGAVAVLYCAGMSLGAVALALTSATRAGTVLLLLGVSAGLLVALRGLGYLRLDRIPGLLAQRRRNAVLRATVREIAARLRGAAAATDIWNVVTAAAQELGAEGVTLTMTGFERSARFARCVDGREPDHLRSSHILSRVRSGGAQLALDWGSLDRDTEIAVERMCEHIQRAVLRIDRRGRRRPVLAGLRWRLPGLPRRSDAPVSSRPSAVPAAPASGAEGSLLWLCFGEGGHRAEARRLLERLSESARSPLRVMSITDKPGIALGDTGEFSFAPLREKQAPFLGGLVHVVGAFLRNCRLAFHLVRTIPSHQRIVAISLGPAFVALPAVLVRARGGVVVHIETCCRFATYSVTGLLMYFLSQHFLVQNEEMLRLYPRATYCGRL